MVINNLISCSMCEEKINTRAQMGYYDILFNFNCPKCECYISGSMKVDEGLILIGATTSKDDYEDEYYTVELSAEFPTKKIFRDNKKSYELTPFMRNLTFYSDSKTAYNEVGKAMRFADFIKNDLDKYFTYFNLLRKKKYSIVFPKLEKELAVLPSPIKVVRNEMDATMALHQLFLTISSLSSALPVEALSDYSNMTKEIYENYLEDIIGYAEKVNSNFDLMEKKALNLISLFSKVYEQLVPVVALKYSENLDNLDREVYGIMTTNFKELTDFYAKSYEWVLDNLELIIALNNIKYRRDYNECFNGKRISELSKLGSKYRKLDFLDEKESFSKPMESFKNVIRNAIQHYDSEIDYVSQKIVFTNKYRGKISTEEIYLIDFASLCLDNFSIIMYLFEIHYTLKKVSLSIEGKSLSRVNYENYESFKPVKNKKISRNSPCLCGSGVKYKKCCGFK